MSFYLSEEDLHNFIITYRNRVIEEFLQLITIAFANKQNKLTSKVEIISSLVGQIFSANADVDGVL
jgi:hypothetical protein